MGLMRKPMLMRQKARFEHTLKDRLSFLSGKGVKSPKAEKDTIVRKLQADLKAVGLAVKIHVLPWDQQSVVAMKEDHSMINFDMPLPTASVLNVMFNSRETPQPGRYGMSFTYVQKGAPAVSRELDALLDAGDNAATFEERRAKFQAAQKIIAENYLGVGDQNKVPGYPAAPSGYVDDDVYEATRCFTGWRVNDGQWPLTTSTGEFLYYDTWHDRFQKTVLGRYMSENRGPMTDGREVLDLLAAHPGTGRFISRKLCRRFIGDAFPQSVVDAAAAEFTANKDAPDQIKRVLRVILLSDAFKNTWGEKLKRPFEVTVSILRALNANFTLTDEFFWNYDSMGQQLFEHRSPNGYPDLKEAWTNTSSMLKRWQMAVSITEGWIDGTTVDINSQMPSGIRTANAIADYWISRILGRPMSSAGQRGRLVDFMRGPYSADFGLSPTYIAERLPRMVALLLMAPDFQYR